MSGILRLRGSHIMVKLKRIITFAVVTLLSGSKIAESRLFYDYESVVAKTIELGDGSGGIDRPTVS